MTLIWQKTIRVLLRFSHSERWLGLTNIICVIGLCVVSTALLLDLRSDAARQAEITSRSLVQLLGRDIARNVELYDLSLREVVEGLKRPEITGLSPTLRQMVLFDRLVTAEGFGRIVVMDRNGQVVASSQSPLPTFSGANREFFRYFSEHEDDGLHIGPPSVSPISGKQVVILSRRVSNLDGSFAGTVSGAILVDYFRNQFADVGVNHAGTVTLYGADGLVVMREPFMADAIGTSVARTSSYRQMLGSRSGSFVGDAMIGVGPRHFVFTQVGRLPLTLSIALAPEEIFASWRWKAVSLGTVVLGLCAVTMVLTWLFRMALRDRERAERATADANVKLERLATTDALTGLFNRRRFDEALAREARRAVRTARPLSLLMLDADCFKGFNDRYGHQKGDEALKLIACAIMTACDPSTDIACRIGGEEFAIIFPDTDAIGAGVAAERIREAIIGLKVPHAANPHGIVSVSGGLAQIPTSRVADPVGLIAASDKALYQAKKAGRNRIINLESLPADHACLAR